MEASQLVRGFQSTDAQFNYIVLRRFFLKKTSLVMMVESFGPSLVVTCVKFFVVLYGFETFRSATFMLHSGYGLAQQSCALYHFTFFGKLQLLLH